MVDYLGKLMEWRGQDSYFRGVVVALFAKLDGKSLRCVAQDERGLLLIKDPSKGTILRAYTEEEGFNG